jgi:integrase
VLGAPAPGWGPAVAAVSPTPAPRDGVAALAPAACSVSVLSNPDPRLPPPQPAGEVAATLAQAQQRAMCAWEAETVKKRDIAANEFASWCLGLPPEWRTDWDGVTPEHALAYLEGCYAPAHATRDISPGFRGPAASTLEVHVAHLRAAFRLQGRVCRWGTAPAPACNPFDSEVVTRYLAGYTRQHARAGYEPVAARPISEAKLTALLHDMDSRVGAESSDFGRVLLLRDQAMMCIQYDLGKRCADCGFLRWVDLLDSQKTPLDPSTWVPSPGDAVTCQMFSKTFKTSRETAGTFEYPLSEDGRHLSVLWRLERYVQARRTAGLAWGAAGWVFSPQERGKTTLKDAPLSSSSFGQRLRAHLVHAGLYHGETAHGLRRGRTQALVDSGLSPEAVMGAMGMKSRRTYELYSDRARPVRGG